MAIINKQIFESNPLTFGLILSEQDNRLDCSWFNPVIENKIDNLRKSKKISRKLLHLKTIADIDGGKRLPKGTVITNNETSNVPYIRATDIKDLKVNVNSAIRIPKEIHQLIQNYQLRQDDLVITIVGTIGEVGIIEEKVEVCDFTENVARIRVKNQSVLPCFILHFLDSEFGKIQTERLSVGSLQYKLSLKSCRNLEVYIPVIDDRFDSKEQKNILSKVYYFLKKSEEKKEASKNLIKEASNFLIEKIGISIPQNEGDKYKYFKKNLEKNPVSRLDALFNNPLRERLISALKKYPYELLGKLISPQNGYRIIPSDFYRLVELEQIDEQTGRIARVQEVPELGSKKILLKEGNILISKLQPEKGKIVIVNKNYDGCVGSSELLPYKLNSSKVSLEYLWAVLRSDYILKQWEYELTGSSRMRIGPNEIENTIVPIPAPKIQEEIVDKIRKKISKSDKFIQEANNLVSEANVQFLKLLTD